MSTGLPLVSRGSTEDVGAEVMTRHFPVSGALDVNASPRRDGALAIAPLPDHALRDLYGARQ